MKKLALWIVALASAFTLAACGGGGGGGTQEVAAEDLSVAVTASNVAALSTENFVFDDGVPGFGTTDATTVTFTGATATPAFSIRSDGRTATGVTTFGSCIFTVTASTFASTHPLGEGKVVRIDPCSLVVRTGGVVANGTTTNTGAVLILGTTESEEETVTVSIGFDGRVTVNNTQAGTVDTRETTGGN